MDKGRLLDRARLDASNIASNSGFSSDVELTTKDETLTVQTSGLSTKHHINLDSDGLPINSKNAHVCLSEKELTELGVQVRDLNGEVNLLGCKVKIKDSSGVIREYVITENLPNETLGLIVCILGDNAENQSTNHY